MMPTTTSSLAMVAWASLPVLALLAPSGRCAEVVRAPAILAHRGVLMHAPENTLAAFELCAIAGVDIELDVYPTRDGRLVVIHDPTVDRTTDGTGPVMEKSLEELKRLDAGSWFHPDFASERIPTLEEVFDRVLQLERRPTVFAINLKPVDDVIIDGVIRAVTERGLLDRSFVFGLSVENSRRFKEREPRIRCAASAFAPEDIDAALKLDFIDVIWTGPRDQATIETIHAAGKQVYFTIINDASRWLGARADGVDGICTNHPLEMKRVAEPPPAERDWDAYLAPEQRERLRYRPLP